MGKGTFRCVTLSDFNLTNLNGYLAQSAGSPAIEPIATPYGQIQQLLRDPAADCWRERPDGAFVWTRPEAVLPDFARALRHEPVDHDAVLAAVDAYADTLVQLGQRVGTVFHASWTMPPGDRGLGLLDLKPGLGLAGLIMRMNLRLAERLGEATGYFLLNAQNWLQESAQTFAPKSWYLAKFPFSNKVFKEAAADLQAAVAGLCGKARKLIIVDLDDTLWGGLVGEVGWEGLTLGGHDPLGEAFVDFQEALKALTRRGVLLGIVSKNEESVALEAMAMHPEMVLRRDDFAGWRINWQDKAKNVADLVAELNLGLAATVFLDDNPAERSRVAAALPEVRVPDWPRDKTLYRKTLLSLRCFDQPALSREDRDRATLYSVARERKAVMQEAQSLDDWLVSLETKVVASTLNRTDLARAAQLLNKTNQLNLSTRRMSESELWDWANGEGRHLWTIRVSDRFGGLGLTGIISLECDGTQGRIVDFLLSCRVMGRKVEETMTALACRHASALGLQTLQADYLPTAKNKPCLDFWRRSGFDADSEQGCRFRHRLERNYPVPGPVELQVGD